MVDKQIVMETIKKMLDSGLENSVIIATLKDVGLGEDEINSYLLEVKGGSSKIKTSEKNPEEESGAEENASVRTPLKNSSHEENVLMHTTTQASLEQSGMQLEEILKKMSEIEKQLQGVSSLPLAELNEKIIRFDKKVSDLSRGVMETKAQTQALREVLEKVLDTNRSILGELESKK